ncbi:T9SS type A sorting domain-containing protein [candidate division KSB1 bacterium]|nr:T9SS type A sorting domain-containing protein [candidate division KSB1 bacterium]
MKCLTAVKTKRLSKYLGNTFLVMAILFAFSQTAFGLSVTAPVDSLPIGASVNDFDGDHHFLQTLVITLDGGGVWVADDDIKITMPTGISLANPNADDPDANYNDGVSVSWAATNDIGAVTVVGASTNASQILLSFGVTGAVVAGDIITVMFPVITSPSFSDGDTVSYVITQEQSHETTNTARARVTLKETLNLVTFAANYSGGNDTTDTDGDKWPNGAAAAITAALPDWVTDQDDDVNNENVVNGTDADFESITLDNDDATDEITFTLWASKLDTIKKISAATAGVQKAYNVTSAVQITDNEDGTMSAENLNSSLLEEGDWYFYLTTNLTADWVVGMSDAVHIFHYPTFTDTDNDAIGVDYDDDGLVEPIGDDNVSSVTLDVSGGLGADGAIGSTSIDDIDFFVSVRDYDDEATFQIFRAPTTVTITADSIKTSGTSPNIVITGLGGATAITTSAQTAFLPYSFYNYEAIRSDSDFDAVGSYQVWVVANDGRHQALQRVKNNTGAANFQLDIKTFPYFVFDDQYYNGNIIINTATTQYVTINWGRLVDMDNELDGNMIINLYCSDLGYAAAGGSLTPSSVDTTLLPLDAIADPTHTVHIATIVDTSDTKQANRYMWDVRNSGLAAGVAYYLYAIVTSDGDAAVVTLNSNGNMGSAGQRTVQISHGSYFLPLTPVEGEVLSLGLGDTYLLTWDAFDIDGTPANLTVGAFMVTAGTNLDADVSGAVEYDELTNACYWLTTSDDGTSPIAYASAPTYADGKYLVDVSVITDDISDAGSAPSGTYDIYYLYDYDSDNDWTDLTNQTIIKADGQLYFSGATDKNGQYNYRLEPTRAMMEKGDTLTVTVYATDNTATNDPMWIEVYVNVPAEYFNIVDQNGSTAGVQAFTPVTTTFNGSVTKNVATVVGTDNQLDFASHYTNFTTTKNLANTAVATFQIVAKTDASGDVMENSNLTINNTGSRISHMLDVNFTQFGTNVPPSAAVVSLAPRGKISGLVDVQARTDSGEVVTLWVCPTGSYDNITDATFLSANNDASATDGIQVTLGPNGTYTLRSVPVGKYDVLCEKAGWTIQKASNQTVQAYSTTSVNFYNADKLLAGDCAGYDHDGNSATTSLPDNQINGTDHQVFESAFESTSADTNWNVYCDVDNDDVITVSDIAYAAENASTNGEGILYKGPVAADDAKTLAKLIVLKQSDKYTTYGIVAENFPALMAYSTKIFINAKQWELVSFEDQLHRGSKLFFEKQNGYNHDFVCASIGNNGSKDINPMLVNFTVRAIVKNPEQPKINDAMLVDIYHRVNVPTITNGIADENALPMEFSLSKNYPNPFNPTTTIEFALPKAGEVKVVVFNTLGQKVRTLVSTTMSAGYYKSIWDSCDDFGKRVSSGMYFYRLEVDNKHISTQKMLLLK